MVITTTARHFDLTPKIRTYGEDRLKRLARYFDQIHEGSITITKEKFRYTSEISLRVGGGADLVSREEATDLLSSIDGAVDRLERQIKRYKERLVDRREKGEKVGTALAEEASRREEAPLEAEPGEGERSEPEATS